MRVHVRDELNVDMPVNLRALKPRMKLYAGIMAKIHDSKFYQSNLPKREERARAEQIKQDESLKDALLAVFYRELVSNKALSEKGDQCESILVSIPGKYLKALKRILPQKDFLIYNVEIIQENPDMRLAFPAMDVLIRASKRSV